MVLCQGVLGSIIEIHRKILKNLEIWYVVLPNGPLPISVQMKVPEGPRV